MAEPTFVAAPGRPAAAAPDPAEAVRTGAARATGAQRRTDRLLAAASAHARRCLGPLLERFRLGEGLLLLVNAAIVASAGDPAAGLWRLALSAGVLAAVYGVNDLVDAEADVSNPKKNQRLVALLLEGRRVHARVLGVAHVALVALAAVVLGAPTAAAVAAMLLVNLFYSAFAKGTPGADLLVVVLWGGLFVAIAAAPPGVCVLVGALTLLMHVFQMQVDVDVDTRNAVRTSAVAVRRPFALVALACAAVGAALFAVVGAAWSLTAALPLAAWLGLRRTEAAWTCSRIYAGVVLLAALGALPVVG